MMKRIELQSEVIREIVARITNDFDVSDIILFGSHVWSSPHRDSDIDLVIILDEGGVAKKYWDKVERRLKVSQSIRDIRKRIPIDLLVYTKDEWSRLVETDSSFVREVNQNGVHLI